MRGHGGEPGEDHPPAPGRGHALDGEASNTQGRDDYPELIDKWDLVISAANRSIGFTPGCTNAFTFKTLLRHYAKWALTLR